MLLQSAPLCIVYFWEYVSLQLFDFLNTNAVMMPVLKLQEACDR